MITEVTVTDFYHCFMHVNYKVCVLGVFLLSTIPNSSEEWAQGRNKISNYFYYHIFDFHYVWI